VLAQAAHAEEVATPFKQGYAALAYTGHSMRFDLYDLATALNGLAITSVNGVNDVTNLGRPWLAS
jgi:hypothetical protein